MNQAHFHLLVNHLPIIVPIIGVVVLLSGIIFRSEIVKRVAYFVFIIGAMATLPSMLSGEGAEEVAENLPGVTENFIHEHEENAETFALFSYVLGAFALIALWANWKRKPFSNLLSYVLLVLSLVVIFLGKQTGTTGGEIRHTEIRSGNAAGNGVELGESSESEAEED
jgi:uncharacterized membrane protein